MGYGIVKTEELSDIADAIRAKLGVQTQYKPSQMPGAIQSISGGGITPTGTKQITENGTYDVTSFASAEVSVPQSGITPTGTKQISITSNGTTTEDVTAYANAEVVVNVPTGITPTGTKQVSVTQNGTTTEDVTNYASVEINASVVNEDYEDALVALGVQSDLTDSIEALTTYANGVTGESDTNLSDAVHSLGSGYGGGSSAAVKYSRYELTGDTTFQDFLSAIQYRPQNTQNCMLFFRASGTVAPTSGSYTVNNFIFIIENGTVNGWCAFKSGKIVPNSMMSLLQTSQEWNNLNIVNGVLTSSATSTSCLGTTGDVVTIAEYPGDLALSLSKMYGMAL